MAPTEHQALDGVEPLRIAVLHDRDTADDLLGRCVRRLREQGESVVVGDPDAERRDQAGDGPNRRDRAEVDVLLDLRTSTSGRPPAGAGGAAVPVWRLSFSSAHATIGRWEIVNGRRHVEVRLSAAATAGADRVLSARVKVMPSSATLTRERALDGSIALAAKAARITRLQAWPASSVGEAAPLAPHPPVGGGRLVLRSFVNRLRALARDAWTVSHWGVGTVETTLAEVVERGIDASSVTWLPDFERGHYLADPFPRPGVANGVLLEEYEHRTGRARIVSTTFDRGVGWGPRHIEFDPTFHVSYPCPVEHGSDRYCTVEAAATGRVLLLPVGEDGRFGPPLDLLEGVSAGDPTIFWWSSSWWLLYTSCAAPRDTHLYLWFADDPCGPWRPHPSNPVKSDVTSSRPAGLPFVVDGQLHRPVQDSSGHYGTRMSVQRVTVLDRNDFAEETVIGLGPFGSGPYPLGPHTLSVGEGVILVDGKRRVSRLRTVIWVSGHRRER